MLRPSAAPRASSKVITAPEIGCRLAASRTMPRSSWACSDCPMTNESANEVVTRRKQYVMISRSSTIHDAEAGVARAEQVVAWLDAPSAIYPMHADDPLSKRQVLRIVTAELVIVVNHIGGRVVNHRDGHHLPLRHGEIRQFL